MHARVSTFEGTPESLERSIGQGEEIAPVVKAMDGSKGLIFLADRTTGRSVSITLWETEEAMRASEEAANRLRRDASEAVGETIAAVDRYEVVHWNVVDA
jgi:heme-degrading monooxygenase HmoA